MALIAGYNRGMLNRVGLKRCCAEFIGTFGLVFAGAGAIVIDEVSGGRVTHLGIGITFGLVVAAMIYALGHVSGAHINPAVTIGFWAARHFSGKRVPFYIASQLGGAIVAALVLKGLFGNVAHLGATFPLGTAWQALALEFVLTFFLMLVIMAVATDTRIVGQAAIAIGATVALEATFAGPVSGASMNPARSFGPALISWHWNAHWVYWVAPVLGSIAGALTYQFVRGEPIMGERKAKEVLFVCVHNAGRSQMAEAFVNALSNGSAKGFSAGTDPASLVNPVVAQAMKEVGINISQTSPKRLTLEMVQSADKVINMGCLAGQICPSTLVPMEDWQLEDPQGKSLEEVRRLRDEIKRRVHELLSELA
jgi:MIP family channel proteins